MPTFWQRAGFRDRMCEVFVAYAVQILNMTSLVSQCVRPMLVMIIGDDAGFRDFTSDVYGLRVASSSVLDHTTLVSDIV